MEIDPVAAAPVEENEDDEAVHDGMTKKLQVTDVIMHPLVLLSVADHYHRVARGTRKRVIGILLGQVINGSVDASNSFALPFEEDLKNPVRECWNTTTHHAFGAQPLFSSHPFFVLP
jgi:JAB1/Mov34/MPN/PAD-1 ubiquitin protease